MTRIAWTNHFQILTKDGTRFWGFYLETYKEMSHRKALLASLHEPHLYKKRLRAGTAGRHDYAVHKTNCDTGQSTVKYFTVDRA